MSDKGRLLIVDDEASVRDSLVRRFADEGYEVGTAESAAGALARVAETAWDIALLDIMMPGTDGIELQRRLREIEPDLPVVIMTGNASVETAVRALKDGAYDYVTKPFDPDDVAHTVRNALAHRKAQAENVRLKETALEAVRPAELVGRSAAMQKVYRAIETVGPHETSVLITGESGTGKELVARAIHAASPRRYNPLVVIHWGALADTLPESELLGHEKGAFTGAQYHSKGRFEAAEGGTVFLDEIGDISLKTQTDLLRVLQEKVITRVGGTRPIKLDFRCVAATHRDLEGPVEAGSFRADLYDSLNVFRIEIPALRDRTEDIPLLAESFLRRFGLAMSRRMDGIAPEAMKLLQEHDWPGNVRELENAVERAMVVASGPRLLAEHFALHVTADPATTTLEEVERAHILRTLEICHGNKTRTALALHIDRVTLHNKLKRYGYVKEKVAAARS